MAIAEIISNVQNYNFNVYETLLLIVFVLAFSYVIGKLVYAIISSILKHFTKKSKTILDDMIIEVLDRPFYLLVMILLFWFSISFFKLWNTTLLNRIIVVLLIIWATYVIVRIVDVFFKWKTLSLKREKVTIYKTYYSLFRRIFSISLYVLAFLMILQEFNIEITPIITGLGIGGLAVALALQDTLSNYFAGIYLSTEKYLRLGDFVHILSLDKTGYIEDIGWRSTKVKTVDGNIIIIPNAVLANQSIMNYDSPKKPINFSIVCGVSYEEDLDKVEKIAKKVAKKVVEKSEHAEKEFEPIVRFYNFGESNIDFKIIVRAKSFFDQYPLQHEIIKALKKEFDKEGITINYPVRTLYLEKGNLDVRVKGKK